LSNVLIGIIGVILFIGLALAGALILGDDFRSSSSATKAATTVQQLQQISAAITMYQLKTGRTMIASENNIALLQPRFLKSYPPANGFGTSDYRINDAGASVGASPVRMVITPIGNDARARDGCIAIEEQTGTGTPDMTPKPDFGATVIAKNAVGCFLYQSNGLYYAFVTV
jgi:hypothetical protein